MLDSQISYAPQTAVLTPLMLESATMHRHLCPRQILGLRMGLYGLRLLGLVDAAYEPRFRNDKKKLLVICETDGCGMDGVAIAVDCFVGRRTLRVLDFGKMACTLVNVQTERALRITPDPRSRSLARQYALDASSRWRAYLEAYQVIPDEILLRAQWVTLTQSLANILSRPGVRVNCDWCGEEIINEREVLGNCRVLCRSCAGEAYYQAIKD